MSSLVRQLIHDYLEAREDANASDERAEALSEA
jgi:hypothetical protein